MLRPGNLESRSWRRFPCPLHHAGREGLRSELDGGSRCGRLNHRRGGGDGDSWNATLRGRCRLQCGFWRVRCRYQSHVRVRALAHGACAEVEVEAEAGAEERDWAA